MAFILALVWPPPLHPDDERDDKKWWRQQWWQWNNDDDNPSNVAVKGKYNDDDNNDEDDDGTVITAAMMIALLMLQSRASMLVEVSWLVHLSVHLLVQLLNTQLPWDASLMRFPGADVQHNSTSRGCCGRQLIVCNNFCSSGTNTWYSSILVKTIGCIVVSNSNWNDNRSGSGHVWYLQCEYCWTLFYQ